MNLIWFTTYVVFHWVVGRAVNRKIVHFISNTRGIQSSLNATYLANYKNDKPKPLEFVVVLIHEIKGKNDIFWLISS